MQMLWGVYRPVVRESVKWEIFFETQVELANLPNLPNSHAKLGKLG